MNLFGLVNTFNAFVCVNRTKETSTKDDIVVEMKTEVKNEETVLLKSVNGDKKDAKQQVTVVSMTSLIYSLKARRSAAFTVQCVHCLSTNRELHKMKACEETQLTEHQHKHKACNDVRTFSLSADGNTESVVK